MMVFSIRAGGEHGRIFSNSLVGGSCIPYVPHWNSTVRVQTWPQSWRSAGLHSRLQGRPAVGQQMRNEAEKTRSLKIAFVVNADHLRRLATVLGEASKQLEYTVGFSDGTSVHYNDVEDIIKLPNSNEHSIISLIAGTPEEGNQTAFVTLRKSDPESPTLEYTLGGPQRNVVYLGAQLDDWVAAIRQWYSFVRSFDAAGAA